MENVQDVRAAIEGERECRRCEWDVCGAVLIRHPLEKLSAFKKRRFCNKSHKARKMNAVRKATGKNQGGRPRFWEKERGPEPGPVPPDSSAIDCPERPAKPAVTDVAPTFEELLRRRMSQGAVT